MTTSEDVMLFVAADVTWRDTGSEIAFYFPREGTGTILRGLGATIFRELVPDLASGIAARDAESAVVGGTRLSEFLGVLRTKGIVVEGQPPAAPTRDLAGRSIALYGPPAEVTSLTQRLAAFGAPEIVTEASGDHRVDLIAFVDDALEVAFHRRLNRVAFERRVPFLSVRIKRDGFELGPLTLPGKTACFECYWSRLQASAVETPPEWVLARRYGTRMFTEPREAAARAVAVEHAALEIARALSGGGAPVAVGAVIEHSCETMVTRHRRILEVPGCSACRLASPLEVRRVD